MRINTITAFQVSEQCARSRVQGKDYGEVLDRAGVLLTPERFNHIQADTISEIAHLISTTSAHQWTNGNGNTQMDLMLAISDKLRALAEDRRK